MCSVHTRAWARSAAQLNLAKAFTGRDPSAMGIDACCHFNALGTVEVAAQNSAVAGGLLIEGGVESTHE